MRQMISSAHTMVHALTPRLLCHQPADMPSILPDGAGVVDAGACCFEYISDVEVRAHAQTPLLFSSL
jgi:hypothetical protein